jgi:transposase InsO family protein
MSLASLNGSLYYVVFIDDFSQKSWIFFSRFQEFKALVENQTGKKFRVLRWENGGEYTSKEFMDFCAGEGIKRELTIPYSPQQNGVVERKNKTIVGAVRALLHDQGLPLFLWAEACYTVVYLQNRSPHRAVGSMTLEEAFSGKKPKVHGRESHVCRLKKSLNRGKFVFFRDKLGVLSNTYLGMREC